MIQVFSQERVRLCLLDERKEFAVTKSLKDGDKEISFKYPKNGAAADYLKNENYIVTQEDEFVIKEVGNSGEYIKVRAVLNLEDLTGKSFPSYETIEKTVAECLAVALLGTGWTVGVCEITKRRTIRKDSVCTALDIISQCISTYKMEVEYHSKTKVIDIRETVGLDRGVYFMEAINLRKPPGFTYSSNDFYTQIRPIGKDGLTISVGGKDYIENHSYSPKNLMLTWKDERYTIAESLAEDAALKLEEMCRPVETYEADIIDLAAASDEYDILEFGIGDFVFLISKTRRIKLKTRIVQITEYPDTPKKNKCQLSTAKKSFADMQQEVIDEAVQEATGTASADTAEKIGTESSITEEEIRLSMEQMKTEILKDVSDGYVNKDDADDIAGKAAKAAADAVMEGVDEKLEGYATEDKLTQEITAAKKDVLQTIDGRKYATQESVTAATKAVERDMSALELSVEESLQAEREETQAALAAAEVTKNDIEADDGTVWRMGIADGLLYFERLEG